MADKSIWYVGFPTYQYNEDVKAIAKEQGLKIIDSRFKGDNKQCAKAPKLTVKGAKEKEPKTETQEEK